MVKKARIAEETLVAMISEKSREGLRILYDNYSAALYGVILRIVQSDEVAEELLQEAFLKIWNNFHRYDVTKGRLFSWMIQIARHLALDKVRSKEFGQQRQNQPLGSPVYSRSGESTWNPDTIGLKEMVGKLRPEYKKVIDLLFFGGYSQSEVAEKLNLPLGTVKTRSRSALLQLRQQFDTLKVV